MTSAHREASIVACPDCRAAVGDRCVWPDGVVRRIPCMNRMRAAERYDGASAVGGAGSGSFVADGLTQLDGDTNQRDITEPLHPQENS